LKIGFLRWFYWPEVKNQYLDRSWQRIATLSEELIARSRTSTYYVAVTKPLAKLSAAKVHRNRLYKQALVAIPEALVIAPEPRGHAKVLISPADMRVSDGSGRTQSLRLYVGNMRARFDLLKQENDAGGIGSILIDFEHQSLYLLFPQANLYLQI
jgi:hypothetical protein